MDIEHGINTTYNRGCRCDLCKAAQAAYRRELRSRNGRTYPSVVRNKRKVYAILRESSCVQCGESDPVVLDFDHIDPSTKTNTISNLCNKEIAWYHVESEIAKCQILCANCHRRKTAKEQNWQK